LLFYNVQKKITLKMLCISQLPHRIYMHAWLQRGLTSCANVSQRSTAWISWLVKKVCSTILTQNQRSEAQKPTKKQARIKSSARKIIENVFWCTEGRTGWLAAWRG
jgi:hypothetical protein